MSDRSKMRVGGLIAALGAGCVGSGTVFLLTRDLDWRVGVSFGLGVVILTLGGFVMGTASGPYRRALFERWGYLAGVTHGGWDPERRKQTRE